MAHFYASNFVNRLFCKGLGLRAQTLATIAAVRELLNSGQTPPPDYGKRCKACSLVEICQPELLAKRDGSVGYVEALFIV
ncbi:putative phage associated protein [Neisseria gonorrhoeae]|uniref:Putative phage associated protein n=1 Tax=Neisseria gonorrhoeae TaxID=485 RepID=A0A378VXW1_NEIGO|nr:putative phage associated protein [Neisseria gonorrhoeae]